MKKAALFCLATAVISACSPGKSSMQKSTSEAISLKEAPKDTEIVYRASRTRHFDLIHTELDLRPDWDQARIEGTAMITMEAHFYAQTEVVLDAQGMDIHRVERVGDDFFEPLPFRYDSRKITIDLKRPYSPKEKLTVLVAYTAKPDELKASSGMAISSNRGFFFINPKGQDPWKPRQAWTQGEAESNSVWFPTFDSPNFKMTQRIRITVPDSMVSLSNGELEYSHQNRDGSRTDVWSTSKPHAPYLAMLAIGKFAVVKDKWRDKELLYYVDPEYKSVAKLIFNHTPEMLEFFSKRLGVDYPWEKYAQVAVHDYVSGAMENTSAVIFGNFVQKNRWQLNDNSNDGIVAHEMFHHWFGDLVTAESWSNLSINESWASYSEILWNEYKNGRQATEAALLNEGINAIRTQKSRLEPIVRFQYPDPDHMFDGLSYAKGARVIHMLRNLLGDEAFFLGVKTFLTRYSYQAVEIPQLRMVFEEVSGRDLGQFFQQWWYTPEVPELQIEYGFDSARSEATVRVIQKQNTLFEMETNVDVWNGNQKQTEAVRLYKRDQTLRFAVQRKPELLVLDPGYIQLVTRKENRSLADWASLFQHYPGSFIARQDALVNLSSDTLHSVMPLIRMAVTDTFAGMRSLALTLSYKHPFEAAFYENILRNDKEGRVRAAALDGRLRLKTGGIAEIIQERLDNDSSYLVIRQALMSLNKIDSVRALQYARKWASDAVTSLECLPILSKYGTAEDAIHFEFAFAKSSGYSRTDVARRYSEFALNFNLEIQERAARFFHETKQHFSEKSSTYSACRNGLKPMLDAWEREKSAAKNTTDSTKINKLNALLEEFSK